MLNLIKSILQKMILEVKLGRMRFMACPDLQYDYLESATCSEHPGGSFRTKTKFFEWDYWNETKSVNLGFWITSVTSDEKVIDSRPFRLYPTWMYDNREKLKSIQIGDLLIPGTHNSGCYNARGLYSNYIYNQEYDIRRQLEAGIRYFDFRIGYYNDEIFYINHDFMWVEPIKGMYYQIMKFLSVSPGEIIVIDYHRFPKPDTWSDDLHRKFLKFTLNILGSKVFIPELNNSNYKIKGPTMEEIWNSGKNILLTYNNEIREEFKQLFSQPVAQAWADTLVIFSLKEYLRKTLTSRFREFRTFVALMAILTPKPLDVVLSRNNLRTLSDYVNPEITKWIRDEWRDRVNIVATDYFFGNNLIEVAIDINTT
ncbi:hypothetical protein WA026_005392 [Henosepilachna vigintioctopunctata]|uniref:Uncharacterized protein n=1 Tax=Henosepilachna vigintioctopunctata TaxID=420089 RepID=A0AAW1TSR3_9CUCU